MNSLRQLFCTTQLALETLPRRLGTALMIVIGTAGVVGMLVSVLGLATGLRTTVQLSGSPHRALILQRGAKTEISSSISKEAALSIVRAPGIARSSEGEPIASVEMLASITFPRRSDGALEGLTVRGVGPRVQDLRPELKLVQGRMFTTGVNEAIVGRYAQGEFRGLNVGDKVDIRDDQWTIVGEYVSGTALESALLTDTDTLQAAFLRTSANSVSVWLDSTDSIDKLKAALRDNPTFALEVLPERDYYDRQSDAISSILYLVAYLVAGIMSVGALLTAANTMYVAVAKRTREIVTLRAIGFSGGPLFVSILAEAMLLAATGAACGALIVYLFLGGHRAHVGDESSSFLFELAVTAGNIIAGVILALAIGLIGGILPALRAATVPVAAALRED